MRGETRSRHSASQRVRIKKTMRKGLFSSFLYVLDFGKKGPFFFRDFQQFRKKVSFLVLLVSQRFKKKGVFFFPQKISVKGVICSVS